MDIEGDITFDDATPAQVAHVRAHRRGLARDRRTREPARLEVREITTQRAVIEFGGIGTSAALAPRDELRRVARVRAARVIAPPAERRHEAAGIVFGGARGL